MKYIFAILLFSSSGFSEQAKNFEGFEEGQSAVSVFVGQPSFVRLDYWLNWKTALFFDVGYHFDKYFYASADYAFYFYNARDFLKKERNFWNSLLFYAGPGFFGGFASEDNADDSFKMGIRLFGGAEYLFAGQKYAIRAELGPTFFLQGDSFIGIQGALGLVYYFGDQSKKSISQGFVDSGSTGEPEAPPVRKKMKKKKKAKKGESGNSDEFEDF